MKTIFTECDRCHAKFLGDGSSNEAMCYLKFVNSAGASHFDLCAGCGENFASFMAGER